MAYTDKLVVLVKLPLLDASGQYEIYSVMDMPVPFPPTNLTAVYDLEFKQFGISKDRTQYLILDDNDMARCGLETLRFCPLNSPTYKVSERKTCVIAVFLKQKANVRGLCKTKVSTEKLPLAQRLSPENWLVAASHPSRFTVLCERNNNYGAQLKPPTSLMYVPVGCRASSDKISLPTYAYGETEFEVHDPSKSLLRTFNWGALDIWQPVRDLNISLDPVRLPKELADIRDMPLGQLANFLRRHNGFPTGAPDNTLRISIAIVAGVAVIAVMVIMVVFKRKLRKVCLNRKLYFRASYSPANCNEGVGDEGLIKLGSRNEGRAESDKEGTAGARNAEGVPQPDTSIGFCLS